MAVSPAHAAKKTGLGEPEQTELTMAHDAKVKFG
jgi:hypothetical protein